MISEKTKIIEAYIVLKNPTRLMMFVFAANELDTCILDLQEQHKEAEITRESIVKWHYMTIEEVKRLKGEHPHILNDCQFYAGRKKIRI